MAFLKSLFNKGNKDDSLPSEEEKDQKKDSELKERDASISFTPKVDPFSHCILNPYFTSTEDFSKVFSDFESRIGSLQRYYEMNNQNIEYYLSQSKVLLREEKKKPLLEGFEIKQLNKCHFTDVDHFFEIHYLSVMLIIFTMFENLLSNLTKDISYIGKVHFNSNYNKNLPYINRYILFLKNVCNLNIAISKEEWFAINTIRKVRNNYLHDLNTDIPDEIQADLLKIITPKHNNKVTINDEFLDMCFSLFGSIGSRLEKAYWDYKRDIFKIKE